MPNETRLRIGNQIHDAVIQPLAEIARNRYVQGMAALIYTYNVAFNLISQKQNVVTSLLHPLTNPFNAGLYSAVYENDFDRIWGATGLSGMYLVMAAVGVGIGTNILAEKNNWDNGVGTIGGIRARLFFGRNWEQFVDTVGVKDPVLIADCRGGLPLVTGLGKMINEQNASPTNLVLTRTAESPTRTSDEKAQFGVWVANIGTQEKEFYDTDFWIKAGGRTAKAIVLNSDSLVASIEAAAVVKEQLDNRNAQIVIVSNNPKAIPEEDREARTGAIYVNPYLETARNIVQSLIQKNAENLIPGENKKLSKSWNNTLRAKKQALAEKIAKLPDDQKLKIYLYGDTEDGEGLGFSNAFNRLSDKVELTTDPEKAEVVIYFGNGDILADTGALMEYPDDVFDKNDNLIKLRVTFDQD